MTVVSQWAANDTRLVFDPVAHVYTLGDRVLPSVTSILSAVGIADFSAPYFTEDVLQRGTCMHQAIALDNEGDLDDDALDPLLVPFVAGWRTFRRDTGARVEFCETQIADPDLGYAGTFDAIVLMTDGRGREIRTLIDLKRGVYPSVGPQTAAYRRLAWRLYDRPVLLQRAALELPGDGSYRWHPLTDQLDEQTFLAALRVVNWRTAHGCGV